MDRSDRVSAVPSNIRSLCACPVCHSGLEWAAESARCASCGAGYSVLDDLPVLLPPGGRSPALDTPGAAGDVSPSLRRLRDFRRRWLASPPLTYKSRESRELVLRFVSSFPPDAVIVNVGSGASDYGPNVINLEIAPGVGVDVLGVAEFLPFRTGGCAGATLIAVLEHVEDADRALSELHRVLAPGGRLLVDVPFIQGYHSAPGDYRRFTEQGLRAEVGRHGFDIEESGIAVGPASAMAWIAAEFLALLLSGRSALAYRVLKIATSWLSSPIRLADYWLEKHPMAGRIASAVWVVARVRAR